MSLSGVPPPNDNIESKDEKYYDPEDDVLKPNLTQPDDPFGNEENAEVKYKTLKWWYVACDLPLLLTLMLILW